MDTDTKEPARIKTVLLMEKNVVIAQDLRDCVREADPDVKVLVARTANDALAHIADASPIRLAIVPHSVRSNTEFFEELTENVESVVLHGTMRSVASEDNSLLYLATPFNSGTVAALYRSLTSS